jgi:hypothetical protein
MRAAVMSTGLALVAGLLVCAPPAATADTGGGPMYMVGRAKLQRASATHPERRQRLASVPGGRNASVEAVVPSPDGRHLAMTLWTNVRARVEVVVTDPNGRHAHRVFVRKDGVAPPPNHVRQFRTQGVAWARGSHRLYFSVTHDDGFVEDRTTSQLWSARVTRAGRPAGRPRRVLGGEGLTFPTTDPHGRHVAGVRVDSDNTAFCSSDPDIVTTSTIVVLHPRAGRSHDLLTVTTPAAYCALPMRHVAWSPDGTQIAFDQVSFSQTLYTGEIDLVAVDGSDGNTPRVAVGEHEEGIQQHRREWPTWLSARSLWYKQRRQDDGGTDDCICTSYALFSVSVSGDGVGTPVRRTSTPDFSEIWASFG